MFGTDLKLDVAAVCGLFHGEVADYTLLGSMKLVEVM
jgi:hypothetical protein